MHIFDVYRQLFSTYGPQGWWPLSDCRLEDPQYTRAAAGYHPGNYALPRNNTQRFEICLGAILTQNTAWKNAEQALLQLQARNGLCPQGILNLPLNTLAETIKPSGYYNVKAQKIQCFSEFWISLRDRTPERSKLLEVWGVGPETADSILLYAYGQPHIVVDSYTRRILAHLGIVHPDISYPDLKAVCTEQLPDSIAVYQEFHALVVEHAKRYYRRRPYEDPILQ